MPTIQDRLEPGAKLGAFTIVRLIGSGGMGRVYEARQESLRRTVAVKVMARRSDSARRRFDFEAKLLARLRHPGIAQIFEVGLWEGGGGVPWFAMEYIANAKPITEYAAPLRVRERLAIFRQVCLAVAHGHQRGVIHRDLKPGNILVDGSGQAKVIDFGVARTTDSDMAVTTMQTDVGQLVGTVQYMSPEQFDADPHDLDIRSDVYALGVILHELLAGQPPYDLRRTSVHEAARIVREEEPPRLSTCGRSMPHDLDLIVRKAMAKDRSLRYGSALDLAEDIDRFLQGRAVSAREPGVWETLRWAARRHRALAGAVVSAFVVMAGSLAVMNHLRGRSLLAERAADSARAQAEANQQEAEDRGRLAQTALARLLPEMHVSAVRHAAAALADGRLATAEEELRTLRSIDPAGSEGRIERRLLESALHPERRSLTMPGGIVAVASEPAGRLLATAAGDGSIRIWSTGDAKPVVDIARSPSPARVIAIADDGRTLAAGCEDGLVRLWDLPSGVTLGELRGHAAPIRSIAFVPGQRALASGSADGGVRVWDLLTHAATTTLPDLRSPVVALACGPDGHTLATCTADRRVRLWDARRGTERADLAGVEGSPTSVAFSRDGTVVAVGGDAGSLQRWTLESLAPSASSPLGSPVRAIAWRGPTSGEIVAATDRGVVLVPASGGAARNLPGLPLASAFVTAPAQASWLACAGIDASVRLLDLTTTPVIVAASGRPRAIALASDGSSLQLDADGSLWRANASGVRKPLRAAGPAVRTVAIDARGLRAAIGDESGSVEILDAETGVRLASLPGHAGPVQAIRFSADGTRVASSGVDGSIRVRNTDGSGEALRLDGHSSTVRQLAFSPDGTMLASDGDDGTLRLWNAVSGAAVATLGGRDEPTHALAFDGTGLTLAGSLRGGRVQLWDIATRKEMGSMQVAAATVEAMSPDAGMAALLRDDGRLAVTTLGSGSR